MTAETCIMGLFTDDAKAARAIQELPALGFGFRRAHGPLPSRRIAEALGLKKSKVGWFTLVGRDHRVLHRFLARPSSPRPSGTSS